MRVRVGMQRGVWFRERGQGGRTSDGVGFYDERCRRCHLSNSGCSGNNDVLGVMDGRQVILMGSWISVMLDRQFEFGSSPSIKALLP